MLRTVNTSSPTRQQTTRTLLHLQKRHKFCVTHNMESCTGTRRITTFRSTTDRMYDGGPYYCNSIIKYYNIYRCVKVPTVFSTVTCCTCLQPRNNGLYHIAYVCSGICSTIQVCVSKPYDVRTTKKSPNDAFLRMHTVVKRRISLHKRKQNGNNKETVI